VHIIFLYMPADLASHMPRLSFGTMIDKHYYHVSKHFMLISVPVIVSHSVSIREDDSRVLC